jgi:NADH-quinone oxidoreductase subunit E
MSIDEEPDGGLAMLTETERRAIEAIVPHYPDRRAACIEALKIVQKHRHWVSDESMKDLAEVLRMTVDELDGVATFYNLIFRKPVGRHVVLVCNSISCWIVRGDELRRQLESRLGIRPGETTPDGRMTLLPIVCLGACDQAPAFMIDDDLHGNVAPHQLDTILNRYP